MNIKKIIFGSPFIRKIWTKDTIKLFHSIDNILENCDVEFLIEPNSKNYGFEYFFTVEEIYKFIKFNKFNNIKTMIDTHNILLSNCNPMEDLEAYFEMISHIHISENKLSPIIESDFHYEFSNKIKELKYDKVVTYEVLKNKNINLDKFIDIYS
jgi:sugar phosphate isomerase/epimerase